MHFKQFFGSVNPFLDFDFQAVIKTAASAASLKTKIQESRGASGRRLGMQTAGDGWAAKDSWILVFGEAAQAEP